MGRPERLFVGISLIGILVVAVVTLMRTGRYGLTMFVALPFLLGMLVSWISRPETWGRAVRLGLYTALTGCSSLLFLGADGLICIAMAFPLAAVLCVSGSYACFLYYRVARRRRMAHGAALLLLLPPGLAWDFNAVPSVLEVRTSVVIAAPPERVWHQVVAFSELPEPHEWYFRAGLAYPERAVISGSGPGAVRRCEFSTGPFIEPVEVWDQPRLLRFRVTRSPAPMHEWSPYARILPRHLHGYLVSERGQFLLTRLPDNRTLLEGTTWYRHGLWPAGYWRLWSDAIIHRIHLRVLNHIRALSESSRSI